MSAPIILIGGLYHQKTAHAKNGHKASNTEEIMINKIASILFASVFMLAAISPQVSAETYSTNHEKVKKLFQSNEEKKVKDAVWTGKYIFKVGVFDDGSKRDGYASYVCQVLYDYGFKGKKVLVQVIDIVKLTSDSKWVKLGQAHCQ